MDIERKQVNAKTKSILLQVAFKEAVSSTVSQGIFTPDEVKSRTVIFYEVLLELHKEYGIEGRDGGFTPRQGGTRQPSGANATGRIFEVDGVQWIDFRQAKLDGSVKPNFPDFKTIDNQTSLWLIDKDGQTVAEAATLATAADVTA